MNGKLLPSSLEWLRSHLLGSPHILGDRKIHLHLGAHKTATTFLQNFLRKNRTLLLEQGVLYLPLSDLRAKLARPLLAICRAKRNSSTLSTHRSAVLDALGRQDLLRAHTVLISNENFSATPKRFAKGNAYSALPQNWMNVHSELGKNIKVFFSIREYPDFFTSMYSEVLRTHKYMEFKDFIKPFGERPSLWSKVHKKLNISFKSENVTMWDFQDSVNCPEKVVEMLTGVQIPLFINKSPVRETLSKQAMAHIREVSLRQDKEISPLKLMEIARRRFPLKQFPAKYDPWTAEQRIALNEIYFAEKAKLPIRTF